MHVVRLIYIWYLWNFLIIIVNLSYTEYKLTDVTSYTVDK